MRFDQVRYANCWEDADVLCEALGPASGQRVLSIASAGDNALALLAEGAEVVAADINPTQLACLELRCAAFRRLEHTQVLAFLGVRPCENRVELYRLLERDLSERVRMYWQGQLSQIATGVIHAGRFEHYFHIFRRWVLPLMQSRRTVAALLTQQSAAAQRDVYDRQWNNWRWRGIFRVFFGKLMMGRLGRDPEFFRYVEGSVGEQLLERVEHGLRCVPVHDNPYLTYILTGNYGQALPRYLRPESFDSIRQNLDRLTIYHGPIDAAARDHGHDGFDGFNLSDIFEYLDLDSSRQTYGELLTAARPGARLVYWNTLVPRRLSAAFANRTAWLDDMADDLHARDRACFYCNLIVDQVHPHSQKETTSCHESLACA
ncbi:MAG: DUF3419 family protein [Phycisphaeraceae bacterium]